MNRHNLTLIPTLTIIFTSFNAINFSDDLPYFSKASCSFFSIKSASNDLAISSKRESRRHETWLAPHCPSTQLSHTHVPSTWNTPLARTRSSVNLGRSLKKLVSFSPSKSRPAGKVKPCDWKHMVLSGRALRR